MSSLALSTHVFPSNAWEFVRSEVEKAAAKLDEQSAFPEYTIPNELALHILSFLSPEALGQACRVCRKWNALGSDQSLWNAFDLKKLFPSLKVIDETVWKNYIDETLDWFDNLNLTSWLSFDDIPPQDKRADIPILKELFASAEVEGDLGMTILTLPKGLSFQKLQFSATIRKNGGIPFSIKTSLIASNFGAMRAHDVTVDKTYRVVITNNVLKMSKGLSVEAKQRLVNEIGCEMPGVLPALSLAILTYFPSLFRTHLYNDSPLTSTHCSDQINQCNMVVGHFEPDAYRIQGCAYNGDNSGVIAMRKL